MSGEVEGSAINKNTQMLHFTLKDEKPDIPRVLYNRE